MKKGYEKGNEKGNERDGLSTVWYGRIVSCPLFAAGCLVSKWSSVISYMATVGSLALSYRWVFFTI